MNWSSMIFDWNQARAFLVTAEEGSLSAAARALNMTQPTLGRQVAALEDSLGVLLFHRTGRALTLTDAGLELLDHVRDMGQAASSFSLSATGQSQTIEGHVTVTAGDITATYVLPRALAKLSRIAPGITVEIVSSNDVQDLRRREADIALRHVRPTQPDLIARLLREDIGQLYATPAYIERYGEPSSIQDIGDSVFAGFEPVSRFLAEINSRGLPLTEQNFRITSTSSIALLEVVRLGEAIGILTRDMARLIPDARVILPDFKPIPVQTWLVSHRELQSNRRMRLVFDLLSDALSGDAMPLTGAIPPSSRYGDSE